MTLLADPSSSSSRAVLRLPHDLPVHPPRLQHLLPVILAALDSPLQDEGFPSVRDPAVFPRCPCPSPVTRPQEQQVLLHFITAGICWHTLVCLWDISCLARGLHQGREGRRPQASNSDIPPNIDNQGKGKKKKSLFLQQTISFLMLFAFLWFSSIPPQHKFLTMIQDCVP